MCALRWVLSPVLWPVFLAWRWLTPQVKTDRDVARLGWLRTAAGALTFLILLILFGTDREELTDTLVEAMVGGICMFAIAFFGGLAYLNRFQTLSAGWRRIRPMAWRFLSCYLAMPLIPLANWLAGYAKAHPMPKWLFYLAHAPQIWMFMLTVTAILLIARNCFNVGDLNPMLPPLITPILSIGGVLGLGDPSRVPSYVSIPIGVIGTLASFVLAWIELGHIRRRYRCTLMQPPEIAADPVTGERCWVPASQPDASAMADSQPSMPR